MQERVMATGIMPAQREVSSQLKLGGKSVVLEVQPSLDEFCCSCKTNSTVDTSVQRSQSNLGSAAG